MLPGGEIGVDGHELGWPTEGLQLVGHSTNLRLSHQASRVGRVVLLSVLVALVLVLLSSGYGTTYTGDGLQDSSDAFEDGSFVESDLTMAKIFVKREARLTALRRQLDRHPSKLERKGNSENIVPASESSSLWDFPEVKRYQVQRSRQDYWKNVDYMKAHHVSDLGWPDESSSGLKWPTEDGTGYTDTAPKMVKAGSLLVRGDVMPLTRPYVEWAPDCSPAICPLDTPHKERAYAWRYCMNHFVTNAEKRYCFSVLLSPPRPPPSCPPYDPPPAHGRVIAPDSSAQGLDPGRVAVGDHVTIECDVGYAVAGNSTPACAAPGVFERGGECAPVECGVYPPPAHGSVVPAGTAARYLDTVGIRCDEGYRLVGPAEAQCGPDGKFTEGGHCAPVMCEPLPAPAHGFVTPSGAVAVGDHVTVVCDEGYAVTGDAAPVCAAPGVFGPAGECAPVVCGEYPPPAHGSVAAPAGAAAQYLDTVGIRCDEGYRLVGPAEAQCGPDGKFSQGGHCEPVTCPPLPPPAHGAVTPSGVVINGQSVNVTCEPGFEPEEGGDTHPVCGPDGLFLSKPAECVQAFCDPYQPPPHGSAAPAGPVPVGSAVTVTCDPDYLPVPIAPAAATAAAGGGAGGAAAAAVSVECVEGKVYKGGAECVVTCPAYPAPAHGSARPAGRVRVGESVEIGCDEGYALAPGLRPAAVCEEDGKYDQPESVCDPLPECPPYPPPAHGAVSPAGAAVPIGGQVAVTCDEGYRLGPNSSAAPVCLDTRQFDHPTAECEPVPECPPYPAPAHGAAVPDGRPLHVGDQVSITCDRGYHLSKSSSEIATCTGFDYDFPTAVCLPNPSCPPLKPPPHATVSPAGNVSEGACVKVECEEGWYMDPQASGTDSPCCTFNVVDGVLEYDEVRTCITDDPVCEICSDIKVCPHCFIGKKLFPAKRRDFNFD